MWLKPFGGYAEQDTRSGTPGFEADTMGIGLGGDVEFNDRLVLGAALVTYGVGGLKLVNSTAQAYAERSPVVVISGAQGLSSHLRLLFH